MSYETTTGSLDTKRVHLLELHLKPRIWVSMQNVPAVVLVHPADSFPSVRNWFILICSIWLVFG